MNLDQRIIEVLILDGAQTASALADRFNLSWERTNDILDGLAKQGQVCCLPGQRPGDAVCSQCPDTEYEDAEPGEPCEFEFCHGRMIDACFWRFCGGPVSQALSVESQISNSRIH